MRRARRSTKRLPISRAKRRAAVEAELLAYSYHYDEFCVFVLVEPWENEAGGPCAAYRRTCMFCN